MSKPRVLIQLDPDRHASVFDAVVAVDAGVDQLLQYSGVKPEDVTALVHGAMFTRGPDDLKSTAIFIGGSRVEAGEALLEAIKQTLETTFGEYRGYIAGLTSDELTSKMVGPPERRRSLADSIVLYTWHEAHHQGQIHLTWNLYKAAHGIAG